jgi:uncharacterized protein YndB with AHSA1/START domain
MGMETTHQPLTGTSLTLTTTVALPLPQLWELVTDMPRIAEWSPECIEVTWTGDEPVGIGARFTARNRFPDGVVRGGVGLVIEFEPTRRFAWAMLDDDGAVGSLWSYDLAAGTSSWRTIVHHRFEHGPGLTGLRFVAAADPGAVARRLGELAANMCATLAAMERQTTSAHDGMEVA